MQKCCKCGRGEANLLCSRCQCAHYCSQDCQYDHWGQPPHPHKDICRECRPVGGVFFEGLQKSSILDLANGKGGKIVRKLGYSVLTANAMALRVSREQFVAALRHARGELAPEWQDNLSFDERHELLAADPPGDAEYVRFASPISAKKRKAEGTPDMGSASKLRRASDATPIKGVDLFKEKRSRKPAKKYLDDDFATASSKKKQRQLQSGKQNKSKAEQESVESDDGFSDGGLEYTDLRDDALVGTDEEKFSKRLNQIFEDTDDGVRFKITAICVSSNPSLGFFFKYRSEDSDDTDEYEFTPCEEIMRANWVMWCSGIDETA